MSFPPPQPCRLPDAPSTGVRPQRSTPATGCVRGGSAPLALAIVASLFVSAAAAQAPAPQAAPERAAPTAHPDPKDVEAPVPAAQYRSAMSGYRPWRDQAVGDWRALNDNVGRIGGWRTYLRQAHEPEPTPQPAPQSTPQPTPSPQPSAASTGGAPADRPAPHSGSHTPPAGGSR
jgi:hypothetical protein